MGNLAPDHAARSLAGHSLQHSFERGWLRYLQSPGHGAVDFLAKPKDASSHLDEIADQLIAKIKVAKRAVGRILPPPSIEEKPRRAEKSNPRCAASPPHHPPSEFQRRPKRIAICFCRKSRRFSIRDCDCAAHAGGFHRNVREAPRLMLRS